MAPEPTGAEGFTVSVWKKWAKAAQFAVLIGILFWMLHDLDFSAIAQTLRKFPPGIFAIAMGAQMLGQALQAWRWKILMGEAEIPYREYFGFVGLGYALALISPSMLISDSANAWMLGRRNQLAARSVSAMLAGRFFGMMAMMVFFLLSLPTHIWVFKRVPWEPRTSFFAIFLGVLAAGFATRWGWARYRGKMIRIWEEIRVVFNRPRALAQGLALSTGVQVLQILLPWLGYKAMDIPVGVTDILFFMPLITLLALAPVSIGQIGVREGLNIFFLTLIPGVTKEHLIAGFGYGYALIAVMGLINLGLATWILKKSKPD